MRLLVVAGIGLLLVGCVIVRGDRDGDRVVEDDDRPGSRPRPDTDVDEDTDEDSDPVEETDATCDARAGGALITLQIEGERFTLWSFDGAFIDLAIAARQGDDVGTPVFAALVDGADCDAAYDWHVDLIGMSWTMEPDEGCEGAPSAITADRDARLGGAWCPAGASVVSVDDRR